MELALGIITDERWTDLEKARNRISRSFWKWTMSHFDLCPVRFCSWNTRLANKSYRDVMQRLEHGLFCLWYSRQEYPGRDLHPSSLSSIASFKPHANPEKVFSLKIFSWTLIIFIVEKNHRRALSLKCSTFQKFIQHMPFRSVFLLVVGIVDVLRL